MKTASGALIALLATDHFLMADLYTITLRGGSVLRWTNFDQNLTLGANTFTCATDNGAQPICKRGEIRNARGTEVGTCDLTLLGGQSATIGGTRLGMFALNGGFDGAQVLAQRIFMATAGDTSAGAITIFQGLVASAEPGATQTVLHLKDVREYLSIPMPRNLWQPSCNNQFCDAGCGLNLATYTQAEAVTAGSTITSIPGSVIKADGYFQGGVLTFTSGANNGFSTPIRAYVGGVFTPVLALPAAPSTGDTFTATAGCARTQAACAAYGNTSRFKGYPYVPPVETAF